MLALVRDLTVEQLNQIPKGFNNNLAWNLGHVLVTQQLLCYKLSGLNCKESDEMIGKYRKGSKPTTPIGEEEVDYIKDRLLKSVAEARVDLENNAFQSFKEYPTSFGITLNNIGDAMSFNDVHEAMHYGYMLALKKLV